MFARLSRERMCQLVIGTAFAVLALPRSLLTVPVVYSAPFLLSLAVVATGLFRVSLRNLLVLLCLVSCNCVVAVLTSSRLLNVMLSLATYSGFYLLAVRPDRLRLGLLRAWATGLVCLASVELAIGLVQLIRVGFPAKLPYYDYFPDEFKGSYGLGGARLVTLLFVPTVFYLYSCLLEFKRTRYAAAMAVFAVATVLPGFNGGIIAAMLAFLTFLAYDRVRVFLRAPGWQSAATRRITGYVLVVALLGTVLFYRVGNIGHVIFSVRAVALVGGGPGATKSRAFMNTVARLPQDTPYQPMVGLGLGNYSSWSQMLLSDAYVQRFVIGTHTSRKPPLPSSYRKETRRYVLKYLERGLDDRWIVSSIRNQPYFSWQSLYAEVGILGLALVYVILYSPIRTALRYGYTTGYPRVIRRTLSMYLFFVVYVCFLDNFLEYPWLTLPVFLGLVLITPYRRSQEVALGTA
jgi:hypothetical protein